MQVRVLRALRLLAVLLLLDAWWMPAPASAHDIPLDVLIQSFVKVEGGELRLLVRAPLAAMRDIVWPQKDQDHLDLPHAESQLHDAATLWLGDDVTLFEAGRRLPPGRVGSIRATAPDDRSFESYDTAYQLLTAPQRSDDVPIATGFIDVLFTFPVESAASRFSIEPNWARLGGRTITVVRLVMPDGTVRPFELEGNPGLVELDPSGWQAAWRFVKLGFEHILDGTDHLLFLFCLVIPFRRFRALVTIVTAFTVAHSITLIASAYDLGPDSLWFPPLIETLIATSIVYMALENIVGARLHRRWLITFGFGLVHGFGFSFALKQTLQFAGSHLLVSLLSFNVGVELGQLLVLALLIPAIDLLFRNVVPERLGTIILSTLVAHTGWHWMTERYGVFSQYDVQMPELTPAFIALMLRYAMGLVVIAGGLWVVSLFTKRGEAADVKSPLGPADSSATTG
ncbi:MAG: HupE/UreJ family protein [Vicinamibacterales bacterium]